MKGEITMKKYKALYLHTIEDLQKLKNAYKEVIDNLREYTFCDYTQIIDSKIRVYNMVIEDIDNEIKLITLRYNKLGGK